MALLTAMLGALESVPTLLMLAPFPAVGVQLGRYHLRLYWTRTS